MMNDKMLKDLLTGFALNMKVILRNNINAENDNFFFCPGDFGLDEIVIKNCNSTMCKYCWETALKDFKERIK
ncbi:MAG: hypothetical protein ACFFDH_00560 [Promethearchaeota archaeon]